MLPIWHIFCLLCVLIEIFDEKEGERERERNVLVFAINKINSHFINILTYL